MQAKAKRDDGSARLALEADTAADLMCTNPVSIREDASILEASALFTDKGFSAAPVIDDAGRPVGVLSRSDLITHDREKVEYAGAAADSYEEERPTPVRGKRGRDGFQIVNGDRTLVSDIMTPVVFSVTPETPARKVVQEMLALAVHRLFVVDQTGVLVGVISASDILRNLK